QGLLLSDYRYDEQGRLKAQTVWQTQQHQLFWRDYSYSANGNLAALSDNRNRRSYQYDAQDRLVRIDHAHSQGPERFAHDPAGNLLLQDRPGPTTLKANRLLMEGNRHYDYDAYGNLIRERRGKAQCLVTHYRYDSQHRLIGVTTPDGNETSYRYDAFGRRIEKTVAGQTTEFIWQGDQVIAESSDRHYQSYVYEPGTFRPLALLEGEGPDNATPFHYHNDHLGTPQELTSHQGEIVWAARYNGYGKLTELRHGDGKRLEQPLRFQGQYHDRESGLHYNRHRYYNPETGRYLTADPIKLAGGLNAYRYVPNPTGWVDPLGLNCELPGNKTKSSGDVEKPEDKTRVKQGEPDAPAPTVQAEKTARVRHYTNRKGSTGIEQQGVIQAQDNNRVYVEPANRKPLSAFDAEDKYQIGRGRGRDYIETDVPESKLEWVKNPRYGTMELTIKGNLKLENPTFKRRK
ncbi:RHS repeat-associated core domain-containing protein, partial [Pseudomonas brassicacearum]|uniref:RHS repeat-associated core domain-containing protein n=1 Tax=Pseudomonas brassicacearum TaxID=930166 RepID=UPI002159D237